MLAGLLCVKKALDGTKIWIELNCTAEIWIELNCTAKIWIEFNCTACSGTSNMTVTLLFYLRRI